MGDGNKEEGVGTSSQPLDRKNKLLPSIKEACVSQKCKTSSERLDTNFLQRTSPKDKSLVEKQNPVIRGLEERFFHKEGQHPVEAPKACKCNNLPPQVRNTVKKSQKNNQKGKKKPKTNGQALPS
ncbi:hypothetical protein O181_048989 [Austropuccinia psidii MF-1]|uniref:Uncharacterized protein n=1 Tax=Austropuccinia psidii MF-1 TaxID=1389203 RepID=A0A9Q3HNE3_9BASI|nr:hypothetical protein [Austropuccinia psidii MF-1]